MHGSCGTCGARVCGSCMGLKYPYWLWHELVPRAGGDGLKGYSCGKCEDAGGRPYVEGPRRRASSYVEI